MNYISRCILFFIFIHTCSTAPVTLVYNLRVRRSFAIEEIMEKFTSTVMITAVPIFFARDSHITNKLTGLDVCEKRYAGGSLFNLRFAPSHTWWAEITTGLETDHAHYAGTDPFKASRTGFDDIVLSAGYSHFFGKNWQAVLYGLVGLPTHIHVTREDRNGALVGTRLFNLGGGGELSYSFINELKRTFDVGTQIRCIHAFNRSYFPVLPKDSTLIPGNATDLLFFLQWREKRTVFETGYNPTFFTGQAVKTPIATIKADTVIRHSWYLSVAHATFDGLFGKTTAYGAGINYNYTKTFDAKTVIAWLFLTLLF